MWQFTPIPLAGAFVIEMPAFHDDRGTFIKTFHQTVFRTENADFTLRESYFSASRKDVIRGMHFQLPPHQHAKVVFCPHGAILDVIVDLRKDSPTYGQYYAQELSFENHLAYYIPEGFAHGFKALTDGALTYYLVSSEYNQQHDEGILFDSFGFDWGVKDSIVSARDLSFVPLEKFQSPF